MSRKPYHAILLFGPPGSGKGTVGKKLAIVTEQFHLSSGEIFRGLSAESPLGKLQKKYSDKGLLVPDEVTVEICLKYIEGLILTNRFFPHKQILILDGFPRTLEQAKLFNDMIGIDHIISLEVANEDVLIDRLEKRALIEGRKDDADRNVLKKRMQVYREQTAEVLSYYPKNKVLTVNGNQTPTEVFRDVLIAIADKL